MTAAPTSFHPAPGLPGRLLLAIIGAIFFSAKAIVAKLMYRYQVDAVMVITLRMLFSFPMFAAVALWKARTQPPLARADYLRIVVLGLMGYYLSSFLDFLGLQYISAGLERLILFLTPSFVMLIAFSSSSARSAGSNGRRCWCPISAPCWCCSTTCIPAAATSSSAAPWCWARP
jgi:hypothetical protein